jgi:hypothetical protein
MLEGCAPVFWSDLRDLFVGHLGQPGEHVFEVGVRIDASAATAFDEGVNNSAALSGIGIAHEEPVLFLMESFA